MFEGPADENLEEVILGKEGEIVKVHKKDE